MEEKILSFKGRGMALCVSVESAVLPGVPDVLRELRDGGIHEYNRQITFDFHDLEISRTWLQAFLRDVIFPLSLQVSQWTSTNETTLDVLSSLGFRTGGQERPHVTQGTLKIITTPLRSGQTLNHDGDVLLLGNLHRGAEINATGSIIVWGALLGQVHAGCSGDNSASVITMSYQTNQLRIGNLISNAMEPGPWWGKPVRIFVESGVFVASEIHKEKEK